MAGTGLSMRDQKVLDLAYKGLTAEDIAAEVHAPVEVVVRELDRLTGTLDWLTDLQRMKLLTHGVQSLLGALKDKAESGQDALITTAYINAIKLAFDQLERQSAKIDADIAVVQNAQAKVLVDIVDRAFYHTLGKLEGRFKEMGLPREEIEQVFQQSIMTVAAEIDAQGAN
jgi:hypothetical protein